LRKRAPERRAVARRSARFRNRLLLIGPYFEVRDAKIKRHFSSALSLRCSGMEINLSADFAAGRARWDACDTVACPSNQVSQRHVKGALFVDYVRMIRGHKSTAWAQHLTPRDLDYLGKRVEPDAWYPMDTFERMGIAILAEIRPDLETIRAWGGAQVKWLCAQEPSPLVVGDVFETLMRFRVVRASFFDYPALDIEDLTEGEATLIISYGMSKRAEEAASWQTVGFFERLLEVAGATGVRASFATKAWEDDLVTTAALRWTASGPWSR
jgi:hypothetical protein